MPTSFHEVVEGSFGGGASHLRQALHLEVVLFAYQVVHIVLQACYMYQGRLDDYDVVVPLISLVFCARRLIAHFASSPDPLELGPHCWLLLRMLLFSLLCANGGYFITSLVQRHSLSAVFYVLAGAALPALSYSGYVLRRACTRARQWNPLAHTRAVCFLRCVPQRARQGERAL